MFHKQCKRKKQFISVVFTIVACYCEEIVERKSHSQNANYITVPYRTRGRCKFFAFSCSGRSWCNLLKGFEGRNILIIQTIFYAHFLSRGVMSRLKSWLCSNFESCDTTQTPISNQSDIRSYLVNPSIFRH